jgi:DNA-binding response OmpR family regulator
MPNVLVIDDDVDLLEMVEAVLTSYDMQVSISSNGSTLFESVKSVQPDIILMDIYLGDADGRELCQNLKSSDEFGHIPVILYSAGNISKSSIHNSKADDFIVKPFDVGVLAKKITSMVA